MEEGKDCCKQPTLKHEHPAECQHESIKYCKKCDVAECQGCGREFGKQETVEKIIYVDRWHAIEKDSEPKYPYWPNTLPNTTPFPKWDDPNRIWCVSSGGSCASFTETTLHKIKL